MDSQHQPVEFDNSALPLTGPHAPVVADPDCRQCRELLHKLANVLTATLLNAQMLSWKVPPHSRMKRTVREMERNTQLSVELLRRFQLLTGTGGDAALCGNEITDSEEQGAAVTAQESARAEEAEALRDHQSSTGPAPLFPSRQLTAACDGCTSGFFPKRDDSDDY
jgi:hypothetical protein